MSLTPEQSHFLGNLRLQLIDLSRRLEQDVNEDVADYVLFRLQQALNHLSRLAASVDGEVFHEVQTSLAQVTTVLADTERNWQPTYPAVNTGGLVGCPKFEISKDQLEYLMDCDHRWSSRSQYKHNKRHLREYGISISERRTDIPDAELDCVARNIHVEFPNAGYRRMQSQLMVRGINVSQIRVRASMQRMDPEGVAMRWLALTPRAVYRVSGPLALWHIDGNHKLIRWIKVNLPHATF